MSTIKVGMASGSLAGTLIGYFFPEDERPDRDYEPCRDILDVGEQRSLKEEGRHLVERL